jgi:hypothetical protein
VRTIEPWLEKNVMHIVLAILGIIVTILILVNRLAENGIHIGWLNPFAWKRRREWAKKYNATSAYSIKSPMEVTAFIMVALAKSEGEISSDQKREIINKFKEIFHLDDNKSSALLVSSVFILKDDISVLKNMNKLLAPSIASFTQEQASSSLSLITHIANFDSPSSSLQNEVIGAFEECFRTRFVSSNEWT